MVFFSHNVKVCRAFKSISYRIVYARNGLGVAAILRILACRLAHAIVPASEGTCRTCPASLPCRQKTMLQKLPKIVLALMVVMILFSPFMQLDSLDKFPVATGDIEFEIIAVLFEIGMFFVFTGILSLFPGLLRSGFLLPSLTFSRVNYDAVIPDAELFSFTPPLRI